MNILVLGSGGRESALAYKLAQSAQTERLYVAPGNAGTGVWAENVGLDPLNFAQVKDFIIGHQVGMLVVGPEDPLVQGIHDYFLADANFRDLIVVGPCKEGARLEGSKRFAKEFMQRAGIPTAGYAVFEKGQLSEAKAFLKTLKPPYVLKADGLAAGKGVLIENSMEAAEDALDEMLEKGKFGAASSQVVIEEFLSGIELSVFVLTDGTDYKILPEAKDYKKVGEGDTGLNTGGMGSVSPVAFADAAFMKKVEERIVKPTLRQLKADRIPYSGFLFIGLMNVDGDPYVIEYNVRMGDPETESVMPRIKSDLVEVFKAMHENRLNEVDFEIDPRQALCVMLVSGGYPDAYKKGFALDGLDKVAADTLLFHAGTKNDADGRALTSGGRVLAVVTLAEDLPTAIKKTYAEVEKIGFEAMYYRKDIGKDLCR
ncbi:MAG: phosphoribosylamine--glycine ligase [Bacteroides sp.]|nr:phosphoribosylamine--glycine ligase [Bacteroides sp.]MCM1085565.1 phosphoribosylamine--glycine ligase [Bacteroides sp.]